MIVDETLKIIARDGFEAATVRRIAAELGFSTKIVMYHFATAEELQVLAYRTLVRKFYEHSEAKIALHPDDLVENMMAMTAVDEFGSQSWRVYLGFWDRASRNPALAKEHHEQTQFAVTRLAELVSARNPDCVDPMLVARVLNALIRGLSLQALTDEPDADAIRIALGRTVEALLGPPAASPL
jgi:AcrR family transcriptional regulator